LDQEYLVQCYFLARKLNAYAVRLGINQGGRWEQLSRLYEILGRRAGLTDNELGGLASLADRLAAEGSVFQFDEGASAFEMAQASKDRAEKTALMVQGIHELLESGKFTEAQQRIGELEDEGIASRMMDYFHFRAGRAAISKRKWQDMSNHSHKITDQQLQVYLFLEGTQAALENGKKELAVGSFFRRFFFGADLFLRAAIGIKTALSREVEECGYRPRPQHKSRDCHRDLRRKQPFGRHVTTRGRHCMPHCR
jgi:hypothetical protein